MLNWGTPSCSREQTSPAMPSIPTERRSVPSLGQDELEPACSFCIFKLDAVREEEPRSLLMLRVHLWTFNESSAEADHSAQTSVGGIFSFIEQRSHGQLLERNEVSWELVG